MTEWIQDDIEIEITAGTNKVRSQCSIRISWDREDWNNMSETDREQEMLDELMQSGIIEWDYKVVNDAPNG